MRAASFLCFVAGALAAGETIALKNAAQPGMTMPAIGLGTGGYGTTKGAYGAWPECWMEIAGCGNYTIKAVDMWLKIGGLRLDAADSYDTQVSVGAAMAASSVPRSDIFLLQKTGSWNPMGYADTLSQTANILQQMNVTYVDLLLNHWPTSPASPTVDPACDPAKPATYNEKTCRLNTWRAYVEIWGNGTAKAIGVANYNSSHLQEIIDAGMPLPSVNQIPIHLYTYAAQVDTIAWCKAHDIVVLAYSPLGIPDWHFYPPSLPSNSTLTDPVVLAIAAAHAPATPAQVILSWLWAAGLPSNPRSMNPQHMADNLAAISAVKLTAAEIAQLSSRPVDTCAIDSSFYECMPVPGFTAPPHPWARRA